MTIVRKTLQKRREKREKNFFQGQKSEIFRGIRDKKNISTDLFFLGREINFNRENFSLFYSFNEPLLIIYIGNFIKN